MTALLVVVINSVAMLIFSVNQIQIIKLLNYLPVTVAKYVHTHTHNIILVTIYVTVITALNHKNMTF